MIRLNGFPKDFAIKWSRINFCSWKSSSYNFLTHAKVERFLISLVCKHFSSCLTYNNYKGYVLYFSGGCFPNFFCIYFTSLMMQFGSIKKNFDDVRYLKIKTFPSELGLQIPIALTNAESSLIPIIHNFFLFIAWKFNSKYSVFWSTFHIPQSTKQIQPLLAHLHLQYHTLSNLVLNQKKQKKKRKSYQLI